MNEQKVISTPLTNKELRYIKTGVTINDLLNHTRTLNPEDMPKDWLRSLPDSELVSLGKPICRHK